MDLTAGPPAAYTGGPEVFLIEDQEQSGALESRALAGDREALAALFTLHGGRLRRMIQIRMADRLRGRIDPSDVLQETWLDAGRRFDDYRRDPAMPLFLWLRFLAAQKLAEMYRRHLGAGRRDAAREVRLAAGPAATSASMAANLVDSVTSPSQGAARAEQVERLRAALDGMDEIDREILTLRHFEELTNGEAAAVLSLSKAAASNRYVRALKRLREALEPGGAQGGGGR